MRTLKEKAAHSLKIEKLTMEHDMYVNAAEKQSKFADYYLGKALDLATKISEMKE
jgi:hypothetical protein